MTWGMEEGWGSGPWGSLADSESGNISIISVRFITDSYIRVHFNTAVVVNSDYLNPNNYIISVQTDSPIANPDAVRVLQVYTPTFDSATANFVYLKTTPHTNGAYYQIAYDRLNTLDGVTGFGSGSNTPYASRVTKTINMLGSIPNFFHKDSNSLLHALFSAISIPDDDIGGSRNDEL